MVYTPDLNTRRQVPVDGDALSMRLVLPAGATSAFGTIIAQPETTLVELQFPYGLLPELLNLSGANGGYISSSNGMAVVNAGAVANGYAALESKSANHYVAGTGGRFKFAGFFASGGLANSTQEVGLGDVDDGFFFGYSGSQFGVCRRASSVDSWIPQTSWNIDRMDGSGPSDQLLDPTTGNVYMISYQWLGYGAITYLIEDATTGMLCPVHRINYANANRTTSIRDPNLPVRMATRAWGSTGSMAISVSSICAMVEGLRPVGGVRRGGHATKTSVSAEVPLMSIQNSGSFNGRRNRMRVLIDSISLASRDNGNQTVYRIVLNATLTNPTWTPVSASNSPVNIDTAASALAGGREIFFVGIGPNGGELFDMRGYEVRIDPGDTLTLTCSGSNSLCTGGGSWVEEL